MNLIVLIGTIGVVVVLAIIVGVFLFAVLGVVGATDVATGGAVSSIFSLIHGILIFIGLAVLFVVFVSTTIIVTHYIHLFSYIVAYFLTNEEEALQEVLNELKQTNKIAMEALEETK